MPRADSLVLDRAIDEASVAQEEAEEEGERERAGVGGEEEESTTHVPPPHRLRAMQGSSVTDSKEGRGWGGRGRGKIQQ